MSALTGPVIARLRRAEAALLALYDRTPSELAPYTDDLDGASEMLENVADSIRHSGVRALPVLRSATALSAVAS